LGHVKTWIYIGFEITAEVRPVNGECFALHRTVLQRSIESARIDISRGLATLGSFGSIDEAFNAAHINARRIIDWIVAN
jgi:hypothetical protein